MKQSNDNINVNTIIHDPGFLQFAAEYGNLSFEDLCQKYQMKRDQKYLDMHTRKIWQGKDGDWYTKVSDPSGKVRLRHAVSRESLERLIIAHYKGAEDHPTVHTVFEEWINDRVRYEEVELGTIDRTRSDYERFIAGSELDYSPIDCVNEDMLTPFIRGAIHDHQLTSKAWNGLKGLITGIFIFAKEKKYTTFSISSYFGDLRLAKNIYHKRVKLDEEQVFTDDEFKLIGKWILETEERKNSLSNLGILLDFYTGLRAGELSTLKYSDFQGNMLTVRRTETRHNNEDGNGYVYQVRDYTKGKAGARRIAVPDEALQIVEMIRKVNPNGEYLFMYGDHRLISDAFSKKLFRICDYIGIPRRSMHKIRKTYASILLDANLLTDKELTNQMGHVDTQVTRDHYYYNRSKDSEKVKKVRKIFEER